MNSAPNYWVWHLGKSFNISDLQFLFLKLELKKTAASKYRCEAPRHNMFSNTL